MKMTTLTSSLYSLTISIPLYLTWLVGLIVAIVNWKKAPRSSLLTVIAVVILFLINVFGQLFSINFPIWAYEQSKMPSSQIGLILAGVGLVETLFVAACWGLIFIAIFNGRKQAE
jgi:hypothetical protein